MATYIPHRGDLVHLEFAPSAGHEMTGPHYALVISTRQFSRATGKCVVCPITSTIRGWPFEVRLPAGTLPRKAGTAAERDSVVLCDQFRTVDFAARAARLVNRAPAEVLDEAVAKMLAVIDPQREG